MSAKFFSEFTLEVSDVLKIGGVGVIPTDTIYGLVGSALKPETVRRIYEIKKRDQQMPLIILIPGMTWLDRFGIKLSASQKKILDQVWPGPVSVIVDYEGGDYDYLAVDTKTLAFRLPDNPDLLDLLGEVGPIVATSANLHLQPHAQIVEEAKKYFGDEVDFYVDGGVINSKPSTLVRLGQENIEGIRRQGAGTVPEFKSDAESSNTSILNG